jgi:hypothetical protein
MDEPNPEGFHVLHSGKFWPLIANITLGWKGLAGRNTCLYDPLVSYRGKRVL